MTQSTLPHLTWSQVCARRLGRHGLSVHLPSASPADAAAAMCGSHAQVLTAGELSIGLRLDGVTRSAVREALWNERSLVKTYGPRGTVHLLPTRDLPMWAGALSALPYGQSPDRRAELLTGEQAEILIAAIADVLEDAELTTDELTQALVDRAGPWAGERVMDAFQDKWPRWRMVQSTAGVRGALCFGPNRGRQVTFTSPRRWLPGFQPMEARAALAGVVRSYLHAYGPATAQQFAQWLSAPRRWAVDLFDSFSADLEQVDLDGTLAWVNAGDTGATSVPAGGVRLLPYFDAYAVGSHPRERVFPGRAGERALAGGQAGPYPVLLIDGIVAGIWHQRRSGRQLDITVEPFDPLTPAQRRELDEQVARCGMIQEGQAQYTIGTVTVGSHA